jgi:hypothetical protein
MTARDLSLLPPDLKAFLDLWESKCRGRAMPQRSDFTVEEFTPWLGRLHLVRVEGENGEDGRYIVFATCSAERYGREMTGKLMSQFEPAEMAERAMEDHRRILNARGPVHSEINDTFGPILMHWSRLAVPLSDDGQRIDRYLVALHYHL